MSHAEPPSSPSPSASPASALRLAASRSYDDAVEALSLRCGGRVGLDGVLADLDRAATEVAPPQAAAYAFAWDAADVGSARWWPQGIATSGTAGAPYAARPLLVTTAYAKPVRGVSQGCRISIVDLADPGRPRYAHVLLVVATVSDDGTSGIRPLASHAGGVAWQGSHLHVASTRSVHTLDLADVVAVPGAGAVAGALDENRLGAGGRGLSAFGYRYVLPVRRTSTQDGTAFRASFVSVVQPVSRGMLLFGEYAPRASEPRRLVEVPLDGPAGAAGAVDVGPRGMQGAVRVGGRTYVTTSHGPGGLGTLWAGAAGELTPYRFALPAGPEDLDHDPRTDRLWTLTEYPGRRVVVALDRARFDT